MDAPLFFEPDDQEFAFVVDDDLRLSPAVIYTVQKQKPCRQNQLRRTTS
jgi:hypothetical protein